MRTRNPVNTCLPAYATVRRMRRLVVVDIENAAMTPSMTCNDVARLRGEISVHTSLRPWDQVVIGCSHHSLLNVMTAWPGVRYVVRSGPDGADRALLDVLDERPSERFASVVLVSGDHIFADRIARLAVPTVVMSHRSALAARLRLAATSVSYLTEAPQRAA